MSEFDMIAKHFLPLTQGSNAALGLKDDAAIIDVPDGYELVVSTDTLNADTHFLKSAAPADIAYKALRASLSDLAAMGADAHCYQLSAAFPEPPDEVWLKRFTQGLLEDQQEFDVFCSGGDTTSIQGGHLSLSITVMGVVPKGMAVQRSGAKNGDSLMITGPVGDALIGLKVLKGQLNTQDNAHFVHAYNKPVPRLKIAADIRAYAHAAIDISDGLVADVSHICAASNIGAWAELDRMQFSKQAQAFLEDGRISAQDLLIGGDDYELALAVSEDNVKPLSDALIKHGLSPQVIGRFRDDQDGFQVTDESGLPLAFEHTGWQHF